MIFGSSGPTLAATPSAPVFHNPFNERGYSANAILVQQPLYWEYPTFNSVSNACTNNTYFNCVNEQNPDFDVTYVALRNFNIPPGDNGIARIDIDFGLQSDVDWTRLTSASINVWCRWNTTFNNGNQTFRLNLYQALSPTNLMFLRGSGILTVCTSTSTFTRFDINNWTLDTPPTEANARIVLEISIDGTPAIGNGELDISTIYTTVYFSGNPQCTGNGFFGDLSCQFQNFGNNVLDFIHLLLNVGLWIVGWAGFAVNFFLNFISIIIWLYAIPGMPSSVQLFVSAYVTGLFGMIIVSLVKMLRGGSP